MMKMHAANNNTISILGPIILTIGGKLQVGKNYTTEQMVYVTYYSDKFFLSHQAWIELGMISDMFPIVGDVEISQEV